MYTVDFTKPAKVHFTGIGGISMSSLAEILLSKGFTVTGSDTKQSDITNHLTSSGARIAYTQAAENVDPDCEVLVYTAAVKQDNPELLAAASMGIPLLTRAQFLGQMMKNYRTAVGVSGTHGKTTTTSMISQVMLEAALDPTILVGGIFPTIKGNTRIGHSDYFITESCEYTNSFLSFAPTIAVILNVEADHLDFFKDIDDIRHSFREFARLVPTHGTVILNHDIANLSYFTENLAANVLTYGFDPDTCDYAAMDIAYDSAMRGSYSLYIKGSFAGHISLNVRGRHNVSNSLAAIACCQTMGIPFETIQKSLPGYTGTDRRFQYKGERNGVSIYDDYAHHPDEIRATLSTAKECTHNHLWCVFQPHTYTRTKALLPEFAESLALADTVILADIYAAREKNTLGVSSLDLKREIEKLGKICYYFPSFAQIEEFLIKNSIHGDMLITMGAGDIVKVGENLLIK